MYGKVLAIASISHLSFSVLLQDVEKELRAAQENSEADTVRMNQLKATVVQLEGKHMSCVSLSF